MSTQTLKPVYKLLTVASESIPIQWTNMQSVGEAIEEGWVVLWQYHNVFTGQIQDGGIYWLNGTKPEIDDGHFVRLRAFNDTQEYHFWRSGNLIKGRIRSDETGGLTEYVETNSVLRSVIAKPLKMASADLAEGILSIRTRNYINYHPKTHQAGYVDSRFVNFEPFKAASI